MKNEHLVARMQRYNANNKNVAVDSDNLSAVKQTGNVHLVIKNLEEENKELLKQRNDWQSRYESSENVLNGLRPNIDTLSNALNESILINKHQVLELQKLTDANKKLNDDNEKYIKEANKLKKIANDVTEENTRLKKELANIAVSVKKKENKPKSESDIEIYVVGGKEGFYHVPNSGMYRHYYVDVSLPEDNINHLNKWYCELVGLYHLWKHSKKKIVGLEHYRRYFCENDVLLSEARIKEILNEYDAIVAPELHPVNKPLYTHRIKNHPKSFNNIQYFDEYLDICDEKLPGFKKMSIEILSKTNLFYQGNRFVAKKSVIDRYCEFMFSNLDELCKRHPLDASNLRNHGYLTEFTFMIWMEYNNIKTFMVDTILFDRNLNQKVTKPYDKLIERKILTSRISATYSMAAYNGTPIKALDIAFVIDEKLC